MRSLNPERHTAATFPHTSSDATKRNESNCPANECCDPSSSTADDRTAKRPPSADNSRSASPISCSISSAGLNVNRSEFGQGSCPGTSASSCSVVRLAVNANGEITNHAGTGKLASPMRSSASALPPSSCSPPSRVMKDLIQYSIDAKSSGRNRDLDTLIDSTPRPSPQSVCRVSAPLPEENKIRRPPPHKTKSTATQKQAARSQFAAPPRTRNPPCKPSSLAMQQRHSAFPKENCKSRRPLPRLVASEVSAPSPPPCH